MAKKAVKLGVLCDTGFLIRLGKTNDPLHSNARGYLKYFLKEGHTLFVSTIALAEYSVKDRIENLPMNYFRVVPFNVDHAQRAGEFISELLSQRTSRGIPELPRSIIPNDSKMFAQADVTKQITHFLTADESCSLIYKKLSEAMTVDFEIIQLKFPYTKTFGLLPIDD